MTEKPLTLEALSLEKNFSHGVAWNVTEARVELSYGFFLFGTFLNLIFVIILQ